MVKFLLYLILTIAMFPFKGHLAILVVISSALLFLFANKLINGTITIRQIDYHRNRYFIIFMLILLTYSVLSIFWSVDLRGWLNYNIYLYIATVSLIVCNYILNTKEAFLEMFNYISITSIIHNVIGWINIITGNYILSSSPLIPDFREKGNPLSLFNNTNDFATYLVFTIFINLVVILTTNKRKQKVIYSLTILSSLIMIYETMSRANYLALTLGIVVFTFLISNNKKILFLLSTISGFLLASFFAIPKIFGTVNDMVFSKILNSGDLIRINLIKNGFAFLEDSKGFGIGAGNISYYLENYGVFDTYNIHSLHNWWLDILVTYGIVIFCLYLIYYGKLLVDLNKIKNNGDQFIRYTAIAFLSILSSYLIGSGSSSSNFPIIWIWIFFSIMIAFLNINQFPDQDYQLKRRQKWRH